ncbi:hypothetical protein SCATT_16300 [Streptantibioticus cattleyicolor NRRL 8057 = DSM 46488]|uniref:Uncharacterized protein n=1 Tax=Streptantibioticus cattleyicolor (strain ATCC 35852 / DSM 46488 / JCM 4925 / NBRC 14057 / NRRL 8057) TaxID=1003195 RepID=G8WNF6_STREN|nr:hypothetical protein SCATT_16300 [Streptantibioticus cattleyicolor NRRL 8057 = DSM 46488]
MLLADTAPVTSHLLPIVIVVSVLGIAFLAWFLLRGYGDKD